MGEHLRERFARPGPKRILALDGGGVRGLLTVGLLAQLEDNLRTRSGNPNYRLCDYFDLIGGTSTGSIIAAGLALGMSVGEVSALYKTVIPKVFKRFWFQGMGLLRAMFPSGPLATALAGEYGARTLDSADLKCGLAIHCKRIDTGSAWVLVNSPGWKYWPENRHFRVRDIVQASAAAPHFFTGVMLSMKAPDDRSKSIDAFVIDGGVAGYNNPAFEMIAAATDPAYGLNWAPGANNLYVLSVGTGFLRDRMNARKYREKTFVGQTLNALRGMIHDVSLQQVAYLQAISESGVRWYINSEKEDQPTAPYLARGAPLLHYQRMDARIEDVAANLRRPEHAQTLCEREITEKEMRGLRGITNSSDANLELLFQIGDQAGQHYMNVAAPPAKFDPSPW